jgi:hypothetical protein
MDTPVSGTPRALLRAEALAVLLASVTGYYAIGASWTLFAALVLLPDLGLIGYLAGPRIGAHTYNTLHTYVGPAVLAVLAYVDAAPGAWPICLAWTAHIGLDRALGFGLKFSSAFRDTHLGTLGRVAPSA